MNFDYDESQLLFRASVERFLEGCDIAARLRFPDTGFAAPADLAAGFADADAASRAAARCVSARASSCACCSRTSARSSSVPT